jgi:hypothetical protein
MKMASTVRQTTLMPPTAPPIMGPRGRVLSGATSVRVSLVAEENCSEVGVSLVGMYADVVGGGVVDGVCEFPLNEFSCDCDEVVDELVDWIVGDDEVGVADTDGGFA